MRSSWSSYGWDVVASSRDGGTDRYSMAWLASQVSRFAALDTELPNQWKSLVTHGVGQSIKDHIATPDDGGNGSQEWPGVSVVRPLIGRNSCSSARLRFAPRQEDTDFPSERTFVGNKITTPYVDGIRDHDDEADNQDHNQDIVDLGEAIASGNPGDIKDALEEIDEHFLPDCGPSCDAFQPPEPHDACDMHEDAGGCPVPCVLPTSCAIDPFAVSEANGYYRTAAVRTQWDAPIPASDYELINRAWAILVENTDVVNWLVCLYYGESATDDTVWEWLGSIFSTPGSRAECVINKIMGNAPRVTIELTADTFLVGDLADLHGFKSFVGPEGPEIVIPYMDTQSWLPDYSWRYADASEGSDERFCIVVDLAGSFLHELIHTCTLFSNADSGFEPSDGGNQCSTTYLIENGFRWAMGQRYSCLQSGIGACWYYTDARLWGNDDISLPDSAPFPHPHP